MAFETIAAALGQIARIVPWTKLRRWAVARDLPAAEDGGYTIIVADLDGDVKGAQSRHIVRSLQRFQGARIYRVPMCIKTREAGDVRENLRVATGLALEAARKYNGDVVIWGEVLKEDHLLSLRMTLRRDSYQHDNEYPLDTTLCLPLQFSTELGGLLFIECIARLLPTLESAGVGAASSLAAEAERLKPLITSTGLLGEDRQPLTEAYSLAALTLFECTGNIAWLGEAMAPAADRQSAGGDHQTVGSNDLTLRARLWLAAAEQIPVREVALTALTWIDRAVAAAGPTLLHHLFRAWAFRLLSRLAETPAEQQQLIDVEIAIYDAICNVGFSGDLRHHILGARREIAVATGDNSALAAIAAEHEELKAPTSGRATIEFLQTLVEHGIANGRSEALEKARGLASNGLALEDVRRSLHLTGQFKAAILRCRVQLEPFGELAKLELEIGSAQEGASILHAATLAIAEAELRIRRCVALPPGLEKAKQSKLAQISAVTAATLVHFRQFHVLEHLARRRGAEAEALLR